VTSSPPVGALGATPTEVDISFLPVEAQERIEADCEAAATQHGKEWAERIRQATAEACEECGEFEPTTLFNFPGGSPVSLCVDCGAPLRAFANDREEVQP
jgi:hypothetical protein